ncbi:MAG: 6-carboxytetrahydropterin synthase [Planctomycetes bacterium]|nr:6-carboxytetrahydropterin synthase [Planctomycetota bacterium]
MLVSREFSFEAAHNLHHYKGGTEPLHGHTWRLRVTVEARLGEAGEGLAFDFVELAAVVRERVLDRLHNRYLNEVVPQPSAENLAVWTWAQLSGLPLREVVVWETADAFVTYRGGD